MNRAASNERFKLVKSSPQDPSKSCLEEKEFSRFARFPQWAGHELGSWVPFTN